MSGEGGLRGECQKWYNTQWKNWVKECCLQIGGLGVEQNKEKGLRP